MIKLKQIIKIYMLKLKLKLKYKNIKIFIGKNSFISTKSKIIMGENSKLIIGDNCYISDGVRIIVHGDSKVIIEDNTYVSINTIISSNSEVIIGENTSIAHNVTIIDTNKNYKNKNILIKNQGIKSTPIRIGNDCWIATGAVILPGVNLGRHCVVGANSVVNKSFNEGSVIVGTPGKLINILE